MDTLDAYYKSKGQTLPSVSERAAVAKSYGIDNYTGTAEQNNAFLGFLKGGSANPGGDKFVAPTGGPNTAVAPAAPKTFMESLQERLMKESGALSSTDDKLTSRIRSAMSSTEQARAAGKDAINASYDRQAMDLASSNEQGLTGYREGQRGFAVNRAALTEVIDTSDKRVKDLEMRRTEMLRSNDAESAKAISSLILQEIQFEQQARQQNFANLLNMSNFALNAYKVQQEEKAGTQLKASDIETFTDENGNVVAKNKITGQTMWTSRGIGRSGSASPNIQVTPIADQTTGNIKYIQQKDGAGNILYLDAATGKKVDAATVQLEKGKDKFDLFLDDILGEMSI